MERRYKAILAPDPGNCTGCAFRQDHRCYEHECVYSDPDSKHKYHIYVLRTLNVNIKIL